MDMEIVPKKERRTRSLAIIGLYLNNIFRKMAKNRSGKIKEKTRRPRYKFGIFPRMNRFRPDTNPSNRENAEIMDMEIVSKIERKKRSLVFMELYLNNIFMKMAKNRSGKIKEKTRRPRYKFGIFPRMNRPRNPPSNYYK